MPTYQYACTACGHQLEAVQSFSDAPLTICPECDGALRKVFSSVGVVFKGSGFYRTDSRSGANGSGGGSSGESTTSNGTKSEATSSTSAAAPASGGSEAKSSTKPAATATS